MVFSVSFPAPAECVVSYTRFHSPTLMITPPLLVSALVPLGGGHRLDDEPPRRHAAAPRLTI